MASSHHNTSPMRAGPHTQSNTIDANTPRDHPSQQSFAGPVIANPVLGNHEPEDSYRYAFEPANLSSQAKAAQQNIHSSFETSNKNNFPANNEHAHTIDPSFLNTGAVNNIPLGDGDSLGASILSTPFNAAPLGESANVDWQGLWDFDYNAIPEIPSDFEAPFPNLDNTQGFHLDDYANYGGNQAPQPSFEQQALPFTYLADDNAVNNSLSRSEVAPEQRSSLFQQFPIYTTDNGTLIPTSEQPQQPQTLETQIPPQMAMQAPPSQGANNQATGDPPRQEMQDTQSLAREVDEEEEEAEEEAEEAEEEEEEEEDDDDESRREETEETTEEGPVGWRPPTFEDLMNPKGRNIDIATRFTSYEEARRALNPPREALDPDLDLTEVQKRATVKALITAINNIEGADDNKKTVQKWRVTSQSQSQPLKVEAAAWGILEAAISYHRSGALVPTLEEGKRKKRGKKVSDKDGISLSFGERISNLIEILRIKKTICKRMVEDSYMHVFVQAPFHCSARVESNRLINEQKGRYIHAGRVVERAEEQKRRQEEAARVASESTQASRATSGEAPSTQNAPSLPMSSAAEIMPNVGGYPLMPAPETMGSFTMAPSDRDRATPNQGPQTASQLRAPYQTPNVRHNAPPAATSLTNPSFAGSSSSSRATPVSRAPSAGRPLVANQPVFQNYTRFIYEDPSVDQPHRVNRTRRTTAPRPANPPHTSPPVANPNPATSRVGSAHNPKRPSPGDKGEGGSSRATKKQRRR